MDNVGESRLNVLLNKKAEEIRKKQMEERNRQHEEYMKKIEYEAEVRRLKLKEENPELATFFYEFERDSNEQLLFILDLFVKHAKIRLFEDTINNKDYPWIKNVLQNGAHEAKEWSYSYPLIDLDLSHNPQLAESIKEQICGHFVGNEKKIIRFYKGPLESFVLRCIDLYSKNEIYKTKDRSDFVLKLHLISLYFQYFKLCSSMTDEICTLKEYQYKNT